MSTLSIYPNKIVLKNITLHELIQQVEHKKSLSYYEVMISI